MKNTKFSKIALLVLSVAILVGCALAFSASAEEAPADNAILAQNLVYGDKVAVAYAINASIEDAAAGKVTVNYYWEGASDNVKKATYISDSTYKKDGVEYPVFITEGVAPKELAKVAYATTDGENYKTYSAAEYLYVRLYEDGFADKTEADGGKDGKDYNRKLLYQHLLSYGAQAQIIFNNEADKLVTDYSIAYTNSDLINFGGNSYVFGYGEITVEATVIGDGTIVGWNVTDGIAGGTTYETDEIIHSLTGTFNVEPIFGVHEHIDEDNNHLCDSCGETSSVCFDSSTDADHHCDICGKMWLTLCDATCDIDGNGVLNDCYNISFENESYTTNDYFHIGAATGTAAAFTADNILSYNTITGTAPTHGTNGTFMNMVTDPLNAEGDKVLKVYTKAYTNSSLVGDIAVANNSATLGYLTFTPVAIEENADIIVFEFDFLMGSQSTKKAGGYYCHQYSDGTASNGNNLIYTWTTSTAASLGNFTNKANLSLTSEAWVRIRIAYKADGSSDTAWAWGSSDNGATWVDLGKAEGIVKGTLERVGICFNGVSTTSTFYFDNMSCVLTTEESAGITLN